MLCSTIVEIFLFMVFSYFVTKLDTRGSIIDDLLDLTNEACLPLAMILLDWFRVV